MVLTKDMLEFIALLKRHKVAYVLVGGLAVGYYGYVRATQDIDILVKPTKRNAARLMRVLDEFGFGKAGVSRELFEREGTAVHLGAEPNSIDILTHLKGVSNKAVFANARRVRYCGLRVKMIAFRDLVKSKKSSDRLKDLADASELEKASAQRRRTTSRRRMRGSSS